MNSSMMASTTSASLLPLSMPAGTSAFRAIHTSGDSLSSSATANCTLTFPAPPPECLLLTENSKNEFLVREKLFQRQPPSAAKSDGSGEGSQLNHTTQIHSRLSGPPTLGTHEHDCLKQSHLVLEQTSNVFSNTGTVPGDSEVLWCGACGYIHELSSAHKYKYCDVIDTDLLCRICKQPLVDPLDTKCGHTFCSSCLKNHLAVQALCPEDKQIINYLECQQSSNLVKRLLDKLLVVCPNSEHCNEVLARCDLESHLAYWCRGAVIACVNHNLGCTYRGLRAHQPAHRWTCPFQLSATRATTTSDRSCDGRASLEWNLSSPSPRPKSSSNINTNSELRIIGNSSPADVCRDGSRSTSRSATSWSGNPPVVAPSNIASIDLKLDGRTELGISLVGGWDTPLLCLIIQEIFLDGLAAKDGRLRPGDQILEVNGEDLSQATHLQACHILSSLVGPVCWLTIYREQPFGAGTSCLGPCLPLKFDEKCELIRIDLVKSEHKRLGIKLAGKKNCLGLYILGLVQDGQAFLDGRLRKDDRILEINSVNLSNGTQEQAAQLIADAKDHVTFLVARMTRPQTPDIIRTASGENVSKCVIFPGSSSQQCDSEVSPLSTASTSVQSTNSRTRITPTFSNRPLEIGACTSGVRVCQERVVVLQKQSGESLGMSVAGGVASQRGDVPIYVTNLHANGIAAQSGRVFRGDILLAVNEFELLGLSHERAVAALLNARDSCTQVTLRLLKGPEESSDDRNFIPSWLFWLQLPRYCQIPRLVVLTRDPLLGLGFSIIGGNDFCPISLERSGNSQKVDDETTVADEKTVSPRPIVVKSVVPGSPCFLDGRIRCGDLLLSVDQHALTDVSHAHAVALLKQCTGDVRLRVVSWPGTIV
ncbi:Ligand of Numb protein X 2 [Paragonimus heterotremus]|uniref:Ligand of Numb protein X 2 n=1 Tax=Paragonimus heterotremus TaxID=100268 RepID=A0A8J4SJ45_9TREM|nr:Ligand of Numb protein X 2 [Paragonimus heterotremus]